MLAGPEVDRLVVLAVAALVAVAGALAFRARPRLAVVVWLLSVAFVPYWMGVKIALYFPPATAMAALVVASLMGRSPARLRIPDIVVAAVAAIAVLSYVAGFATQTAAFTAVATWGLGYLLARVLAGSVDVRWIYGAVAVVLSAAALLAIVEFATGVNLFVGLPPLGGGEANWRGLQSRGGIVRAEGAFGHSIALGACLAMSIPLAVGSRLPRWLKVTAVATLLAGTVVTFSRIGIGTAVIGLVLCLFLMRSQLGIKLRLAIGAVLVAAAVVAVPMIEDVFTEAGSEASGSAQYRGKLVALIGTMRMIGVTTSRSRTAEGVLNFSGFESIDSAYILAGLTYGLIVVVLLLGLHVAAVVAALRREPDPALIAVAAQVPALASVALITQYAIFFWFVAGLAVSAYAARRSEDFTLVATGVDVPERPTLVSARHRAPLAATTPHRPGADHTEEM